MRAAGDPMIGSRRFKDRREAGRHLAEALKEYKTDRPIVLALPRGGVPVGYEVALALDAPLDVEIARKLGAPGNPEFGIGAVAASGVRVLNEEAIRMLDVSPEEIDEIAAREAAEVQRRLKHYRQDRPPPDIEGRTVIMVDDGLATGVTSRAAIEEVRMREPGWLVLAVPVGAAETVKALAPAVDDLVCLEAPEHFLAVGYWYDDFSQTTDEEVLDLLTRAREAPAKGT